jgi:hypothetical protein
VAKASSTGSLRKYQGSEQDVNVCALVNIKGLTSVKEFLFCNFDLAYLPCRLQTPIFAMMRITKKAGYSAEDMGIMKFRTVMNN